MGSVRCRRCDYDLATLEAGACPECGRRFDPRDPTTYETRSRRWRHGASFAAFGAVAAAAVLAELVLLRMPFGSYQSALTAHVVVGAALCLAAAGVAGWIRSWPGRVALAFVGILCLWAGLAVGVDQGYRTWQSMPDPPDEAFADGAKAMAALLLGWLPATIVFVVAFAAAVLANAVRRRCLRTR